MTGQIINSVTFLLIYILIVKQFLDFSIYIKKKIITGIVYFNISYNGTLDESSVGCWVGLLDADGVFVANTSGDGIEPSGFIGKIEVPNAKLWWPYMMDPEPGYLYTLEVTYIFVIIIWFASNLKKILISLESDFSKQQKYISLILLTE